MYCVFCAFEPGFDEEDAFEATKANWVFGFFCLRK